MKSLISGFCTAFSMYSILPMPNVLWNKNTMKYAFCFFPLVGAIIGGVIYLANLLFTNFEISPILYGAIMLVIPLFISGAIHLDGFIDTCDAKYSRQDTQKKLEILKDPHVGAFGVIMCCLYLIMQLGLWAEFYASPKHILTVALGFVLSRCLSGLSVVTFKTAKDTGLAHIFADNAGKTTVKITMIIAIFIIYATMLIVNLYLGLATAFITLTWFFLYRRMCYKEFGGITGDLAGFFLQIEELLILAIAVSGGALC